MANDLMTQNVESNRASHTSDVKNHFFVDVGGDWTLDGEFGGAVTSSADYQLQP